MQQHSSTGIILSLLVLSLVSTIFAKEMNIVDNGEMLGQLSFSSLNESQQLAVQDTMCCSVSGSTNYVYCLSGQTCCRKAGYTSCIASSYACCSSSQYCSSNVCVANTYSDYDGLGYGLGFGIPGFIIFIVVVILVSAASRKRRLMMMRRAQEQAAIGATTIPPTLVTQPPVTGTTTVVIQNPGPGVYYPPQQPYPQQYGQPMVTQQPYPQQYPQQPYYTPTGNGQPPSYVPPQPSYYTPTGNGQQPYV